MLSPAALQAIRDRLADEYAPCSRCGDKFPAHMPEDCSPLLVKLEADVAALLRDLEACQHLLQEEREISAARALSNIRKDEQVAALTQARDWQPIETAPNGEMILLYAMSRKDRERRFVETGISTDETTWDKLPLWFTGVGCHPATHWQPLPAAPLGREREQR